MKLSTTSLHAQIFFSVVLLSRLPLHMSFYPQVEECSIWLAPSSIPGAGLGIYAGKQFSAGDKVTPGDIVIPLVDMHWHNDVKTFDDKRDFLWDEYTWSAGSFREMEQEGSEVYGASLGIGAVPNCLYPVINMGESYTRFDTAGLSRDSDPGVGAFTPYHDRYGFATKSIPAGHEIFVDYGHDYFLSDDRLQSIGVIPFSKSFRVADDFLYDLVDLIDAVQSHREKQDQEEVDVDIFDELYEWVVTNVTKTWKSRDLTALPRFNEEDDFLEELYFYYEEGAAITNKERSVVEVDWLEETGTCMGNLEIRSSTVSQAGRGAFARTSIPEGHVVSAVPVIHLPSRDIMNVFDIDSVKPDDVTDNKVVHQQLLLNYCFGHADTTLLLCPYGIAVGAVNHGFDNTANAKIVWNEKLSTRPEWWDLPIDDWAYNYTTGLVFDYVATRDIAEGEEVLIDYGDAWAQAWQEHLQSWKPKNDAFVTEDELNYDLDGIVPTMDEHAHLYRHVNTLCHESYVRMHGVDSAPKSDGLHRCRVRHRDENDRYVVEVFAWIEKQSTATCFVRVRGVMFDVPRDAFTFQDVPYSRDHAQTWSFRHEMLIPDNLLPAIWRNAERGKSAETCIMNDEGICEMKS